MKYLARTPFWLKWLYPKCIWDMPNPYNAVYLSFDDGPHPIATPFVLETLRQYNAKATFFCIGKNVAAYPELYAQILAAGHAVGNHTQHHANGWTTPPQQYLTEIEQAATCINSLLFRPPYGKITRRQLQLINKKLGLKTVMWSLLSADFDTNIAKEKCWQLVQKVKPGDIVVFHDSEKAFANMSYTLPKLLKLLAEKGMNCEKIE
jgi:peptidoglycan-N-acetylglucosamine deacetylase